MRKKIKARDLSKLHESSKKVVSHLMFGRDYLLEIEGGFAAMHPQGNLQVDSHRCKEVRKRLHAAVSLAAVLETFLSQLEDTEVELVDLEIKNEIQQSGPLRFVVDDSHPPKEDQAERDWQKWDAEQLQNSLPNRSPETDKEDSELMEHDEEFILCPRCQNSIHVRNLVHNAACNEDMCPSCFSKTCNPLLCVQCGAILNKEERSVAEETQTMGVCNPCNGLADEKIEKPIPE